LCGALTITVINYILILVILPSKGANGKQELYLETKRANSAISSKGTASKNYLNKESEQKTA
jgi:hypothetical protein